MREIEFLDQRGVLNTQFDKFKVAPFGLFGGGPGACGKLALKTNGQTTKLQSKTVNRALRPGDRLTMYTQGGGGFGDPGERDPELIKQDLREQKVTPEGLQRDYRLDQDQIKEYDR